MKTKRVRVINKGKPTGVLRQDIIVENTRKYEVYGLWFRDKVYDLKNKEEISILLSKKA